MNGNFPQTQEQFVEMERTVLQPGSGESVTFRPEAYIPDNVVYESIDLAVNPVVAEIVAGGNRMAVFKDTETSGYFLMPAVTDFGSREDGKTHFVPTKAYGIPSDGQLIMGKKAIQEAKDVVASKGVMFAYLSREHFTIKETPSGEISIMQVGGTHETEIIHPRSEEDPDRTIPKEELKQILSRAMTGEVVKKPFDVGMAEKALRGEDRILIDRDRSLYGVFDGAGGHEGAAEAAELARNAFAKSFEELSAGMSPHQINGNMRGLMFKSMQAADAALTLNKEVTGISTGTVVGISEDMYGIKTAVCVSVGDSRCYSFRPDSGELYQETYDEGEGRYLDNALGGEGAKIEQLQSIILMEGDTLMICSDGITGDTDQEKLDDKDIAAVLKHATDSQTAAETLLAISKKRDDKSVVVVRI